MLPPTVDAYVVTVGGSDDHKNVQGLLRSWAHVERALDGSPRRHHLVIAGAYTPAFSHVGCSGPTRQRSTDRVVFTGRLDEDELVAVLQGASLAVTPSLEEGFGLPVLEAAACGTATIASNVSSLPEVLDEPAAGFDPHHPQAIADAIVRALTDGDHRADAARRRSPCGRALDLDERRVIHPRGAR